MAAVQRTFSFLQLTPRMKSPHLFIATIAISSSWRSAPLVESFSICNQEKQRAPLRFGMIHRRNVHLPPRSKNSAAAAATAAAFSDDGLEDGIARESVTGSIYELDGAPTVKLFTKQGCTLCDKVKDVLESVREDHPHSLYAVDITDDDKQEWFSKYKYDIPVLHINDVYWAKHRLAAEDAIAGITEAGMGDFAIRSGEPDASRLEHN